MLNYQPAKFCSALVCKKCDLQLLMGILCLLYLSICILFHFHTYCKEHYLDFHTCSKEQYLDFHTSCKEHYLDFHTYSKEQYLDFHTYSKEQYLGFHTCCKEQYLEAKSSRWARTRSSLLHIPLGSISACSRSMSGKKTQNQKKALPDSCNKIFFNANSCQQQIRI